LNLQDDRYFLSGSLDGKLRLWNIPDKKVALWNEIEGPTKLITAANFCQNGKFAAVGTYDGRVIFYNTEQFKYHTQIHIRSSSSSKKYQQRGPKVTGITPWHGEDKVLVSTTDSRIRLYDLRDLSLSCKYKGKGFVIRHNHLKADFSHDGKYIVTGTDNAQVYFWKTHHDYAKFSSARRDRNIYYESIRALSPGTVLATFSPNPQIVLMQIEKDRLQAEDPQSRPPEPSEVPMGYVVVTAENSGYIRVLINKCKPKHSSLPASAMA
jgi:WD40 repeat protein